MGGFLNLRPISGALFAAPRALGKSSRTSWINQWTFLWQKVRSVDWRARNAAIRAAIRRGVMAFDLLPLLSDHVDQNRVSASEILGPNLWRDRRMEPRCWQSTSESWPEKICGRSSAPLWLAFMVLPLRSTSGRRIIEQEKSGRLVATAFMVVLRRRAGAGGGASSRPSSIMSFAGDRRRIQRRCSSVCASSASRPPPGAFSSACSRRQSRHVWHRCPNWARYLLSRMPIVTSCPAEEFRGGLRSPASGHRPTNDSTRRTSSTRLPRPRISSSPPPRPGRRESPWRRPSSARSPAWRRRRWCSFAARPAARRRALRPSARTA